jgi:hypothetical protein
MMLSEERKPAAGQEGGYRSKVKISRIRPAVQLKKASY